MAICLDVKNLTVVTHNDACVTLVDNVSFSVDVGKNTALIGESGAGKTVTVLALLNLLPRQRYKITQGTVLFDGHDLLSMRKEDIRPIRGRDIGFVFQNPGSSLNPLMTIEAQLMEAFYLHQNLSREDLRALVLGILKKVHLTRHVLEKYPHALSGGEKQRVLIAIAITNKPKLLIADEPTASLDLLVRQEIMMLLSSLSEEMNMSMLLISHDDSVVQELSDKVYFMDRGQIVAPPAYAFETIEIPKFTQTSPKNILSLDEVDVFSGSSDARTDLIVQGATFDIREGESLGVAGETGSGKTSLALAIMGGMRHDGRISFEGGGGQKALRAQTHYVFQNPTASFNPKFSVKTILVETLRTTSTKQKEFVDKIVDALDSVGLEQGILSHYPDELSGGQAQRVAIAQALLRQTRLIVFDEPTASLDKRAKNGIIKLLKKLQEEQGCTYMVISHDLSILRALCHRIAVMRQGRIVEISDTETIFEAPRTFYTRELIGHFKQGE